MDRWKPFPLYALNAETPDITFLPTDDDFQDMAMARFSQQQRIDEIRASENPDEKLVEALESAIQDNETYVGKLQELRKTLKDKAICFDFEIRSPSYGEYVDAEEDSKDWINEKPIVNDRRLSINLMAGRVRRNEKVLGIQDIKNLHPSIATKLWVAMKNLMYPSSERLGFIATNSSPTKKETESQGHITPQD